ncbi:MAG: class I SAM-dependent methyltransferase [Burkholderiales bacterium]|nr:class I SAM-dependent methyltransferase [Burkholderiales bacterium]
MNKPEHTSTGDQATSRDIAGGVKYDAAHANGYDLKIRALIPGYALLHELSAYLLAEQIGETATVLVGGCGTGEELSRYAALGPGWQLTGIDPSADMLALAEQRMVAEGIANRVRLCCGKLGEVVLAGSFAAATSLLVMHFLPDDGAKLNYLRALATVLPTGAPLLLADLTGERGSEDFDRLFRTWRRQQDATRHNPDNVALDFAHLARNVHPVSAERCAALLDAAGFKVEQEYWRALGLSAVLARRV